MFNVTCKVKEAKKKNNNRFVTLSSIDDPIAYGFVELTIGSETVTVDANELHAAVENCVNNRGKFRGHAITRRYSPWSEEESEE